MKPILFNTEMVRSLLSGRKRVTRRVVKGIDETARFIELDENPSVVAVDKHGEEFPKEIKGLYACFSSGIDYFPLIKAPYRPGDILYVRETWSINNITPHDPEWNYKVDYDCTVKPYCNWKWHPSIHMPKEAARLFLRVTDVRVERLQKITPEQIDAEGCKEYGYSATTGELLPSSPSWFKIAWNHTIKKVDLPSYGWDANPWVWVIEFERVAKDEATRSLSNED